MKCDLGRDHPPIQVVGATENPTQPWGPPLPLPGLFLRNEARGRPRLLGGIPRSGECCGGWPRVAVSALLCGVTVEPRGPKVE
jgi:hypothetical protein